MIEIHIKDTTTGESRLVETTEESWLDEDTGLMFLWLEGNYSCDHNRVKFFRGAAQEAPQPGDEELACDSTRFVLRVVENGDVVFDEEKVD